MTRMDRHVGIVTTLLLVLVVGCSGTWTHQNMTFEYEEKPDGTKTASKQGTTETIEFKTKSWREILSGEIGTTEEVYAYFYKTQLVHDDGTLLGEWTYETLSQLEAQAPEMLNAAGWDISEEGQAEALDLLRDLWVDPETDWKKWHPSPIPPQ